jgi:hypothetical protein
MSLQRAPLQRLASVVPPLSASQLGLFRIVFGTALLTVFFDEAVFLIDPLPRDLHRDYSPLADIGWVHWLAASETALTTGAIAVYLALAAFIVGLYTRLAFFIVSIGFFCHAIVVLQSSGVHNLGVLTVTLLGLLIVPWGDGLSVDSRFARSRRGPARSQYEYGFAIWLPGFTMGLAFLAAAIAKLTFGGLAWITDGAVKYHFVEDAFNAPTSLGLWVASHQAAAVACSLGAVAIEALFVLNVLNPSPAWRAAFGLSGAVLLSGFYLFHGVFWPGWWLLLLVFLPWQSFNPRATPIARVSRTLPWQYSAIVLGLLIAQAYASASRTEVEPLLTWFPMYAHTWESTEDFDAAREERMSRFSFWIGDMDITDWVERVGSRDALVAAATKGERSELLESQRSSLKFLRTQYQADFDSTNTRVEIRRDRQAFDWTSGQFVQVEHDALLGIVELAEF